MSGTLQPLRCTSDSMLVIAFANSERSKRMASSALTLSSSSYWPHYPMSVRRSSPWHSAHSASTSAPSISRDCRCSCVFSPSSYRSPTDLCQRPCGNLLWSAHSRRVQLGQRLCCPGNGEIAPAHLTGIMAGMYQTFTGFGALLGSIVSNEYSTATGKRSYQEQLALILIVPVSKYKRKPDRFEQTLTSVSPQSSSRLPSSCLKALVGLQ